MLKYFPKELGTTGQLYRGELGAQLVSNVNNRTADGQERSSSNWHLLGLRFCISLVYLIRKQFFCLSGVDSYASEMSSTKIYWQQWDSTNLRSIIPFETWGGGGKLRFCSVSRIWCTRNRSIRGVFSLNCEMLADTIVSWERDRNVPTFRMNATGQITPPTSMSQQQKI
jgi:hypothetical protein